MKSKVGSGRPSKTSAFKDANLVKAAEVNSVSKNVGRYTFPSGLSTGAIFISFFLKKLAAWITYPSIPCGDN